MTEREAKRTSKTHEFSLNRRKNFEDGQTLEQVVQRGGVDPVYGCIQNLTGRGSVFEDVCKLKLQDKTF